LKILDIQVSCPKMYTYRFDNNFVFDNIVKYIKFNDKSLIYKNWIDSNLLYVNDITDENGRISQDYLIEKLKNKINFFSEFSL
jgi:hypothetical protein